TDQIAGKLDVRVEQISQPDVNINLVTLNAKGSEKQHELQLRIRVKPAVWPDADFLLLIAVIQRNIAGQRPRADRRLEAGIAKS
ncbi:hypothetical protein, partial [Escherichia coli]|uniref:hypothetical protein n=1 Tax=Escherichia coli TaxID=562 RepID=UPI003EE3DFF1